MITVFGRLLASFFDTQTHTSASHWAPSAVVALYTVVG